MVVLTRTKSSGIFWSGPRLQACLALRNKILQFSRTLCLLSSSSVSCCCNRGNKIKSSIIVTKPPVISNTVHYNLVYLIQKKNPTRPNSPHATFGSPLRTQWTFWFCYKNSEGFTKQTTIQGTQFTFGIVSHKVVQHHPGSYKVNHLKKNTTHTHTQ